MVERRPLRRLGHPGRNRGLKRSRVRAASCAPVSNDRQLVVLNALRLNQSHVIACGARKVDNPAHGVRATVYDARRRIGRIPMIAVYATHAEFHAIGVIQLAVAVSYTHLTLPTIYSV